MSSLKNQAVIGLVIVIVLGAGYLFFFTGNQASQANTTVTTADSAGNTFSMLLNQLGPLTFDTSVFSDTRYASLTDLRTPVTSEPGGRIDPFAPLAGVAQ